MQPSKGPRPRPVIALANKLLAPFPSGDFDPERLVGKACKRSGLPALDDSAMLEGLSVLCRSLDEEARLTPLGRIILRQNLLDSLQNRLKVHHWHTQHPELHEPITRPLIIVGLPRTGTTLLSNLLDLDPFNRSLYQWQTDQPVPPPDLTNHREDERIMRSVRRIRGAEWLAPNMQAVHPTAATLPCECLALFEHDFRSMGHEILAEIPSFSRWRDSDDMRTAYGYHKQVLQMLQHTLPTGTWSLKTPCHLWALPALMETYPDATLIFTHRDLARVIPSMSNFTRTMRNGFSDDVDCMGIGREWVHKVDTALSRAAAYADQKGPDAFCHVQYPDLLADPIAVIDSIYRIAGREMSDLFKRNIQYWMQHPPAGKHGRHIYDAADFGLTTEGLRERFADYYARYSVPVE